MKLATLCYVRKDGKTLMVHRNKKPNDMHMGKWNGLGGKLEPGESPEACCIREMYEETGLRVQNPIFKGMITFPAFDTIDDWYTFLFVIHDFEGELIDSPEGRLEWVDDEHLLELNLWEGDRVFLPWLDRPGFFSARFVYEDYQFASYEVTFYHDRD
jgi:8-oxo-dGTP diphosphatase